MKRVCSVAAAAALTGALILTGCWNPFRGRAGGKRRVAGGGRAGRSTAPAGVGLPGELKLKNLWDLEIKLGKVKHAWVWGGYAMLATESPPLLYLLRLGDGKVHWICEPKRPIETRYPPAVSADAVMVVSENRILRIDRAFGELVCILDPKLPISARPVLSTWVHAGAAVPLIFAPSYDGRVWSLQIRRLESEMPGPAPGQPPIKITRYAASRGWSTAAPRGGGHILAPLSRVAGFIYACSTNGYVMGLKESTGIPVWRLQTQGQVEKGVCISKDSLYFGSSDFKLYGVNRLSGEKLWELPTGSVVRERPLADPTENLVVAISQGQGLFGVDSKKGTELWRNKEVRSILGIGEKAVYTVGRKGHLMALNKKDGKPLWRSAAAGGFRAIFPNDEQYEKAGQPLHLLALTRKNEIVCLVEPDFRPGRAAKIEVSKPEKPKVRVIKGKDAPAQPEKQN